MRVELFVAAWILVGSSILLYVVWGSASDLVAKRLAKRERRVLSVLSVVLFESEAEAERVHPQVRALPRRDLLRVMQTLAVDLDGQARDRLEQVVRALGLERYIRRRAESRRWPLRVQAAQLQYLVTHPDFDRRALLRDRHPMVRARAAESLTQQQAAEMTDVLVEHLADPFPAVAFAAQQAVLRAGSAAVPQLREVLATEVEPGAEQAVVVRLVQALEVAVNLPDPRLVPELSRHTRTPNPAIRSVAARALGHAVGEQATGALRYLLADPEEEVRIAALHSLARMESLESVRHIGACLGDPSFRVRRASGEALASLGAPGRLMLRRHLDDPDRFARDMARQVLDAMAAQSGLSVVPALEDHPRELEDVFAHIPAVAAGGGLR